MNNAFLWTPILFQTCQTPIRPISPSSLLDSICWSISEPTSTASIYTDSFSSDDVSEHQSVFFDANGDGKDSGASFTNLTRSLTERWLITLSAIIENMPHYFCCFSCFNLIRHCLTPSVFCKLFAVRKMSWYSKTTFLPYYFHLIDFLRWGLLHGHISAITALHVCRFWIISMPFIRYDLDKFFFPRLLC